MNTDSQLYTKCNQNDLVMKLRYTYKVHLFSWALAMVVFDDCCKIHVYRLYCLLLHFVVFAIAHTL